MTKKRLKLYQWNIKSSSLISSHVDHLGGLGCHGIRIMVYGQWF